jgi:hypothetical protein
MYSDVLAGTILKITTHKEMKTISLYLSFESEKILITKKNSIKTIVLDRIIPAKTILFLVMIILASACSNFPPLTKKGYIKNFIAFFNN